MDVRNQARIQQSIYFRGTKTAPGHFPDTNPGTKTRSSYIPGTNIKECLNQVASWMDVRNQARIQQAQVLAPLHPTPFTLHPTPYTLHPTPYTLHSKPRTLHPTPYTLHPTPHTLNPTPYTLHP